MDIIDQLKQPASWQAFLQHKVEKQHISMKEYQRYVLIYESENFKKIVQAMQKGDWVSPIPVKKVINKQGAQKKRVVYTYDPEVNLILKLICFGLNQYDDMFCTNCYAFRVNRNAGDAVNILKKNRLEVNIDKLAEYKPGDTISFLGFCFKDGEVGLSEITVWFMSIMSVRSNNDIVDWRKRK